MKRLKLYVWSSLTLALIAIASLLGQGQALAKPVTAPGMVPDYFETPNWANSPPLTKFVDSLAGLCQTNGSGLITGGQNNLGQCIPVAVPNTTIYPGSDYYEIALVEYREQMHSELPALSNPAQKANPATTGGTRLRGYVQMQTGTNNMLNQPHYLGPVIVATKGRPVRIKFINQLPTGAGGNLFLPVDTSLMGSGEYEINYDPITKAPITPNRTGFFTQNRAELHLHGGRTPWISDGTPHQWTAPEGDPAAAGYPKGVAAAYVPDMWFDANGNTIESCAGQTTCGVDGATNNPGPGALTYFYTNQQSARLMFYHDHAWGITRLNVYAGEAAGYIITDDAEANLFSQPPLNNLAGMLPLIIQDKTFVDPTTISDTDPTWAWGTTPPSQTFTTGTGPQPGTSGQGMNPVAGDLWWPHVYMPAQNPFNPNLSGINDMGRWHYGPWFFPSTPLCGSSVDAVKPLCIDHGVLPNPYFGAANPGQPPEIPGTPNVSWGAEAFLDTMMVNGTVYPTVTVNPGSYRLRFLNASHDRFLNLQFYQAEPLSVVVMNGGSNYTTPPDVNFVGGGGSGATATATLTGSVAGATITNGGSGYTSAPTVTFLGSGSGATGTATISQGVTGFSVGDGGSGYTAAPAVSITGGGGTGAAATATLNSSVTGYTISNGGSGYTAAPTVVLSGGGGSGAVGTAAISGGVAGLSIANVGTGYTAPPVVTIDAPPVGGTQASAIATITGAVNSFSVSTPGTGYTSPPTVLLSGGGGDGATATATISGGVSGYSITNGGSGYTAPPAVTIEAPPAGGIQATASAVMSGSVNSFSVSNGGSGYTSAPTVDLAGGGGSGAIGTATISGGVTSITLANSGTGYTSVPAVTISAPPSGTQATATATTSRVVYEVIPTNGGSGYSSTPTVTFSGGGATAQATATASIRGPVSNFTVTSGGSGYTSAPTVVITGDGVGATATATVAGGVVTGITLVTPGINYSAAPAVTITGGGGTGASATATISASLTGITLTSQGVRYLGAPTVTISGGGGTGASALARTRAIVTGITITNAGTGYTSSPTVTIAPPAGAGGIQATATAAITGIVSEVIVTAPGAGYTSAPTVSFTGGGGTGAVATAAIASSVTGITITGAGSGYTTPPVVTIDSPISGTQATATSIVTGVVTGITVNTSGSGYTSPPFVNLIGGGGSGATATAGIIGSVTAITVTNAGAGYTTSPAVTIAAPTSGLPATATAIISGSVTGVSVTASGTGYTSAPDVIFSGGGGTGAVATAAITGSVSGITLTAAGSGFTTVPTVTIDPPTNGTQAAATATLGGVVSGVTITNGGTGYTGTTNVSFNGGGGTGAIATAAVTGSVSGITITSSGTGYTSAPTVTFTGGGGSGATAVASIATEVAMVPASATPGFPETWPVDAREGGVPDPAFRGPAFIQFGTEGGFLPGPVVLNNQPVQWNVDPTMFNVGNVLNQRDAGGTLFLAPAERADTIVDFRQYAGKTLILYNDAPTAFPALDPHYDYYTGAPDRTDIGGYRAIPPGVGPNNRTIMQIRVTGVDSGQPAPNDAIDTAALTTLQNAFAGATGVFATGQDEIVVGQSAYDTALGKTFPAVWPNWGISRISDGAISFMKADGTTLEQSFKMKPKAIHDEMGGTFDEFGRMSAKLGLEAAFTNTTIAGFFVQNYVDPATEIVKPNEPQVWRITHNGVDTHPIHFHLFDVQVLNRVGWDGFIRLPDDNELGWKDTVRISPLEDTIVAFRPVTPVVPFALPDSIRPLNPQTPVGPGPLSNMGFSNVDPNNNGEQVVPLTENKMVNFGYEYVWHCHILSHEENDMMRTTVLLKPHNDFNYDGKTDILWQRTDGSVQLWNMNGLNRISTTNLPSEGDTNWKIVAAEDFNHDGKPDILWRNSANGNNRIWLMSSASVVGSTVTLPQDADLNWEIAATGDLNNDRSIDIIWRNSVDGQTRVWLMDGTTFGSSVALPTPANLNIRIVGTGDFDLDGNTDILLRNPATAANFLWLMNGTTRVSNASLPTNANADIQLVGTGDFNLDGKVDILWRNTANGNNFVWLMNRLTRIGNATIQSLTNTEWNIVGR